jgi:hypothetical protein
MSEHILARRKRSAPLLPASTDVALRRRTPAATAHQEVNGVPSLVGEVLQTSGRPLDAETRVFMEPRFGHDFGQVRVHTDERAAESADAVSALAYTVGQDVVFGQGQYAPTTGEGQRLIAHELTHVVQQHGAQQSGRLMVGPADDAREHEAEEVATTMSGRDSAPRDQQQNQQPLSHMESLALVPLSLHTQAVQRDHHAEPKSAAPVTLQGPTLMVTTAYKHMFDNQRSGLERLGKALQKKKADTSLIGILAAAAVGLALTQLLGPVGPAAEALVLEESEKLLVKKAADLVIEKTVETAKDGVKEWVSETKKTDPIDNFIEAQSLALNDAEEAAVQAFLTTSDSINALPKGPDTLKAMAGAIDERAKVANSVQIAHSAGAWASLIAEPGDSSKAWANDDYERYAEKGALEIEAHVAKAPISGPGDIEITGANWRGINRETERIVREHGGATIGMLGTNLRVIVSTPYGETRCEIRQNSSNPIIPEKSTLQGVMAWLISGEYSGALLDSDRARVLSGAAVLGYYLQQKSVSELEFE